MCTLWGMWVAVGHVCRVRVAEGHVLSTRYPRLAVPFSQEALREISVLKRLQHANVVALYEVIDDPTEDSFFMVQEVRHVPCCGRMPFFQTL